jgi:hypothetical protein
MVLSVMIGGEVVHTDPAWCPACWSADSEYLCWQRFRTACRFGVDGEQATIVHRQHNAARTVGNDFGGALSARAS